jgi:hypothetical protein
MRLPKGSFSSQPGQVSPVIEQCHARGVYPEFCDPDGTTYGLPTYPFHAAPRGMATLRQLRERGLRPGGQPVQAQIVWKHRGPQRDRGGQGRTTRRVACLFSVADAKPKRTATPGTTRGDRQGAGGPADLPELRRRAGLLHLALAGGVQPVRRPRAVRRRAARCRRQQLGGRVGRLGPRTAGPDPRAGR